MRGPRWLAALGAFATMLSTAACGEDEVPALGGECRTALWAKPMRPGEPLSVRGSWDEWHRDFPLKAFGDGWYVAELDLDPGEYGYLVVEEGAARLDRYNGQSFFRRSDEQEVSRLVVEDCTVPRVEVTNVTQVDVGTLRFEVQLEPAQDSDATPQVGFSIENQEIGPPSAEPFDGGRWSMDIPGLPQGKHTFQWWAFDDEGRRSPPIRASGFVDAVAPTWADGILYQVVVDRFRTDDGSPPADPPTAGSRAGGTLRGVTTAIEDGFFSSLGVSALWLSPVYVNPEEAREGREGEGDYLYEGYHGYWPLESRAVDPKIGGEAALHELIAAAHAQGIRVLLDLVPNHLYEANPRVAEHADDDWFHQHDPPCVCGTPSCPWSDFIRTCWFADYLPDLRFENPDVLALAAEDAVWWQETFDVDGFRIDAIPMMPRAASRRIAWELRRAAGTREAAFTLGEIFTGAGTGGTNDLAYYLGPDGLDSAFDFPLMWALRGAVATGTGSFTDVETSLAHTDAALDGSGAESQLGRMIGNHDVTRFASETAGDAGQDGWTDPAPQSADAEVYELQRIGLGIVLTLPGLPVIYYGDEVALAGGSDPDNRRVLPALEELSDAQAQLLADTRRLATLRRCLPALRQGVHRAVVASTEHYAYVRDAGDGAPALVIVSTADEPTTLAIPIAAALPTGPYEDVLGGAGIEVGGGELVLELPPRSIAVYVPAGNGC